MTLEWWRPNRGSTWHACEDYPQHNELSLEPDIYTMIYLCERKQFQRDGRTHKPWIYDELPARRCKKCEERIGK